MNAKFSIAIVMLGTLLGVGMRVMGFSYMVILAAAAVMGLVITWACRRAGIGMQKPKQVLKKGD